MMAIVLLGAMTLAHAVKRHGQVVYEKELGSSLLKSENENFIFYFGFDNQRC
jgi:hypothetical protein